MTQAPTRPSTRRPARGTTARSPRPSASGSGAPRRHVGVLIIGSGFAGLGAAIRLTRDGREDFLVVERGSEVGGTWRDNTYPGAACDVPSHLYSFSFELNPRWSRSFSPQPEIQQYLRDVADKYGVLDKHLFDTEVTLARWDAAATAVARRHHQRRLHRRRPRRRGRRAVPSRSCRTSRASRPSAASSSTPPGGTTTPTSPASASR